MAFHRDTFNERYPQRVRIFVAGVVLLIAIIFYAFPRFRGEKTIVLEQTFEEVIETVDIPQTEQFEAPPPPSRPSIPVESESEDYAEDITIEETELESFEWVEPPPPPEDTPVIPFIPYDEAPVPIGGYEAIQRNAVYPRLAREAGIQGTVVIHAYIDTRGIVQETMVLSGIPMLNDAAVDAVSRARFQPAKQRDRVVAVWISIPVIFQLTAAE